ncbi:MFS transporter [Sphaerisporangium sp. TRM90804]|uniref:MFS transporter n=1 Tax=Sphaerisporangium sp. TRM90804 TaxID=3031113 RepID=UPI00244B54C8|nr:MFS transporter [Sphaerisporangium sp. TRM90804]MDH2424606.1 MFS transporter [Sphaerisporangium sp. TRM90804]
MSTSTSSYRILAAGMAVTSLGRGLYVPTSVVYFSSHLRFSVAEIGLALGCAGVAAFLAAVPMGSLMDAARRPRNVAIVYALLHATAMACLLLVESNPSFTLVVAFLGAAERGNSIARQTLVATLFESADRVNVQAKLRTIANAGISVGALMAALAFSTQSPDTLKALIAGNAAALLVLAALSLLLPAAATPVMSMARDSGVTALRDTPFLAVTLLNGILSVHSTVLRVGLPLWVTLKTDAPTYLVAVLYATNTVLTVLMQVKVARRAQTVPTAAAMLRVSGVLTALSCLTLMTTQFLPGTGALAVLFVTTVLLTLGELTQSAGGWGLAFGLARTRSEGSYLGAFSLGTSVQDFLGPIIITTCLVGMPVTGSIVIALALVAVVSIVPRTIRFVHDRAQASPEPREDATLSRV